MDVRRRVLDHVLRGTPRAAVDHGVEGALVEGYVDGARGYVVHVADVHELPSDAGDVGVPLGHEVDDYLGEVDAELVRVPAFCEVPREGLVLNKAVSQRRMATSINHDAKQQDIHPSSSSSTSIPTLTSALGYELYDGRMGHRGGGKTHTVSRPEVENLGIRRRWARIEELRLEKGQQLGKGAKPLVRRRRVLGGGVPLVPKLGMREALDVLVAHHLAGATRTLDWPLSGAWDEMVLRWT